MPTCIPPHCICLPKTCARSPKLLGGGDVFANAIPDSVNHLLPSHLPTIQLGDVRLVVLLPSLLTTAISFSSFCLLTHVTGNRIPKLYDGLEDTHDIMLLNLVVLRPDPVVAANRRRVRPRDTDNVRRGSFTIALQQDECHVER